MIEIRVPKFPECSEPCGACFNADDVLVVHVVEVLVAPDDKVTAESLLAVVETNKTTLEVTAPRAGTVLAVMVAAGDKVTEGAVLLTLTLED